jgi:hypothetical protein
MNLLTADWSPIALWAAVIASGIYHGLNPGMGWPLAVSAALMERRAGALPAALGWMALGHLLAMLLALLPFALLSLLIVWRWHIQLGASLLVIAFGAGLLIWRRHPRALARIPPTRLALWSFAVAMAHGAGLMLVPIYLGLCGPGAGPFGQPANSLFANDLGVATAVSAVHALAMLAAAGMMALLVYRFFGLSMIARSWFNLDVVWAGSLILTGGVSLVLVAMG